MIRAASAASRRRREPIVFGSRAERVVRLGQRRRLAQERVGEDLRRDRDRARAFASRSTTIQAVKSIAFDPIDGQGEHQVAEGVLLAPHLGRRRGDLQPVGDQPLVAVTLRRDDHQALAQIAGSAPGYS